MPVAGHVATTKASATLAVFLGLFGHSILAHGSGFLVTEPSAAALGRGGTISAHTDDPASAWCNPAALTFGSVREMALTGMLYAPRFKFTAATGGEPIHGKSSIYPIPGLAGHGKVSNRLHASLAVFTPHALAVTWPKDWSGARYNISTRLWTLAINPSLAVLVHPRLAIAGGVTFIRGDLKVAVGFPSAWGQGIVDLSGDAWGLGINLGVLYRVWGESLHLGATYRSRTRLSFQGHAQFAPERPALGATAQGIRTAITFPDTITIGLKLNIQTNLALLFDVERTRWSSVDHLAIQFEKPNLLLPNIERARLDPWSLRFGVEWQPGGTPFILRYGMGYEQSTNTPDTVSPSGPDSQRWNISLGLGHHRGPYRVDLGYKFSYFLDAPAQPPEVRADGYDPAQSPAGTYRVSSHLFALTFRHGRN
jgi:long-chain fatty acid transport protein